MNNPTLPKNDPEPDSFGQVFIFSAIDVYERNSRVDEIDNWVLFGLYFPYRFLLASLGSFSCSFTYGFELGKQCNRTGCCVLAEDHAFSSSLWYFLRWSKWCVGNFIAIAVAYAFFMLVTMFVLLVMDALECYLHALRLHWYLLIIEKWMD